MFSITACAVIAGGSYRPKREICHAADTGQKIFYKGRAKLGRCFTRGLQAFENTGVLPSASFGYNLLILLKNMKLYF
jgi:hypothetical protein